MDENQNGSLIACMLTIFWLGVSLALILPEQNKDAKILIIIIVGTVVSFTSPSWFRKM